MKQLFTLFACLSSLIVSAQTATVYRGGTILSSHSTIADASAAATMIGDSIVLSPHTFKEHNIAVYGGQIWKGTITTSDSTIIDAEKKECVILYNNRSLKDLTIHDVILTNGKDTTQAAVQRNVGSQRVILKGRTVIRNCIADSSYGVTSGIMKIYDFTKIYNNQGGKFAGVALRVDVYDSAEICYNSADYGGVAADDSKLYFYDTGFGGGGGGGIYVYSQGVKVHHNKATKAGGVVTGSFQILGGQIYANEAPTANFGIQRVYGEVQDAYMYNPGTGATRQPEIIVDSTRELQLKGAWFGDSDTTGVIVKRNSAKITTGKYAVANWSINRGKTVTKKDSLFPVGALITYQDGSAIPAGSYSWLKGNFTTTKGTFLTPKPGITKDTVFSLYRTVPFTGDTSGKPVDFVCNIDLDTFKVTVIVWAKTSINNEAAKEMQVLVYPNPATNIINIDGLESGSSITVQDLLGRQIKTVLSDADGKTVIDISELPAGNYILKITTKEGAEGTAKVIKE